MSLTLNGWPPIASHLCALILGIIVARSFLSKNSEIKLKPQKQTILVTKNWSFGSRIYTKELGLIQRRNKCLIVGPLKLINATTIQFKAEQLQKAWGIWQLRGKHFESMELQDWKKVKTYDVCTLATRITFGSRSRSSS